MNASVKLATIALIALPIMAAAEDEGQKFKCSDMLYSQAFLAKFPKAPAGCQDVTVKDGQKYAHFWGEVESLKDNHVTISIKNVRGDSLGEITVAPTPEARLKVEGKEVNYSSLTKGQRLDFWLPEGRFGFYSTPGESAVPVVEDTM